MILTKQKMSKYLLTFSMALCLLNACTAQPMAFNNGNYPNAWKEIEALDNQGLPKSALAKVDSLYIVAKKDENPSQVVKTLIYKSKYLAQLEEDGFIKAVAQIQIEAEKETFPTKPILQSMLAEMYAGYLENNVWRFRNRTTTVDFKQDDIRTWDIEKLNGEAARLYKASVEDKRSQQVPIKYFDAVTTVTPSRDEAIGIKGSDDSRPTLYDFLAHRAIDFFTNEKSYLAKPAYAFDIDNENAFAPVEIFNNLKFVTTDTASGKFIALKLMQDVIKFHQGDKDNAALIDVDLKRLAFMHSHSTLDDKDNAYLKALEALQIRHKNNPAFVEISYKIAQLYKAKGDKYKPNPEKIDKNAYRKAIELCKTAIQQYPKAYGVKACRALMDNITEASLEGRVEQVNVPQKTLLTHLTFRNVDTVHFKIIKVNKKLQTQFENDDAMLAYYNGLSAIRTWSVNLPNENDHHSHSTETKIDKLPLGSYILMASDNARFQLQNGGKVTHNRFHVSNIAYVQRGEEGNGVEYIVMDRTSGLPQKGVKAEFFQQKYNAEKRQEEYIKATTAISDAKGFLIPKLESGNYYNVKFMFGKDTLDTNDGISFYRYDRNEPKKYQFVEFFTDRAIYRPSQTIYFKGILLEKDEKGKPSVMANKKTTITFLDVNRQKIADIALTSNEFGTINGSFTAPASGLLGYMSITSDINNSSHGIRVEEYKRPKFEVKLLPLEGDVLLNQEAKVKGNAKAFAGSNIDGAKVKYRVVRTVQFPYWKMGGEYWNPWGDARQEIAHGEIVTDANGDFTIPFKAIPNKAIPAKQKPVFNYTIYADVTDISGETHSTQTVVNIGYTVLVLGVDMPTMQNRKSSKPLVINANNHNGQPLAAKVDVKIDLLTSPRRPYIDRYWSVPDTHIIERTEFTRLFPFYAYKGEDKMDNWATKRKIYTGKFQTISPVGKNGNVLNIPDMRNWEPGAYRITLSAQDATGEKIETIEHFTLYDADDKLAPVNKSFLIVSEKDTYKPYEEASFYIGTSEEMLKVLFEIERDGKIETQNWMDIVGFQKMKFKIEEADRGNIFYHITYIKNNRFASHTETVVVPYSNKELNIEYQTFRDKLQPGQEEEWRVKITGENKDRVAAEMVAAMYDASLDQFAVNSWAMDLYPTRYSQRNFVGNTFQEVEWQNFYQNTEGVNENGEENRSYRALNWYGFSFYEGGQVVYSRAMPMAAGAPPAERSRQANEQYDSSVLNEVVLTKASPSRVITKSVEGGIELPAPKDKQQKENQSASNNPTKVRTNLNETVFFLPTLMTDDEGSIIIKFKMNEALTRWKFLALAHTKDLKVGMSQKEIVTQKDLMVFPNAPRFLREGDAIEFAAKVSNLSGQILRGSAILQLFDGLTMQPIDIALENKAFEVTFEAKEGQSSLVTWKLKIPTGKVQAVTYRIIARAGNFSDGEESTLPVLTNRMLVTETIPLSVRAGATKKFEFKALKEANSNTLQHHKLTLEFTQNPAWYAVQALPYLMEYPYECTEQIFSRFYANSLATDVANSQPKIKSVFERWKNVDITALQSNLSKNQELKTALLEETPWVLAAQNEELQKKNIGLLFDLNKMASEAQTAIKKMQERQLSNGGFAWFPGGRDDWYISQYITEGFGHLDALGVKTLRNDDKTMAMIDKSINYCDARVAEYYAEIEKEVAKGRTKWEDDHTSNIVIHYLYTRSFFKNAQPNPKIFNYFVGQIDKYWLQKSQYEQGLIALALKRYGKESTTNVIVKSLKERSLNNDELGMYWKNEYGYYWYQMPIETHALMIELFNEVGDAKSVDDLKVWLLKNKQTNAWKTTKATASAVYALLKTGNNWLVEDKDVDIKMADKAIDISKMQKEAGTGYFKTTYKSEEITAKMGDIEVKNPNSVVSWGAIYWQYFENLDKIKIFKETPLKLDKQLFKETYGDKGKSIAPIKEGTPLSAGDKIKVRIELRVDRDMEYIHLKDMRASGFEPTNVLSQYKWQGGLGYYESTKDASTNFFIDRLPKGTYVFEYPLVVTHKGDFSNGVTTIQCMYAPEFTSHSEGVRVKVEK
jgi:uncharacterized protein YfaS (alpha-2-macroglobulin family)